MNAVTDVQLHRYHAATVDKVKERLDAWKTKMSTPEHPVNTYFIQVGFEEASQLELKLFLNKIPTSFSLTDEQVDTLISSARSILGADQDFQQLLSDLTEQ